MIYRNCGPHFLYRFADKTGLVGSFLVKWLGFSGYHKGFSLVIDYGYYAYFLSSVT